MAVCACYILLCLALYHFFKIIITAQQNRNLQEPTVCIISSFEVLYAGLHSALYLMLSESGVCVSSFAFYSVPLDGAGGRGLVTICSYHRPLVRS